MTLKELAQRMRCLRRGALAVNVTDRSNRMLLDELGRNFGNTVIAIGAAPAGAVKVVELNPRGALVCSNGHVRIAGRKPDIHRLLRGQPFRGCASPPAVDINLRWVRGDRRVRLPSPYPKRKLNSGLGYIAEANSP